MTKEMAYSQITWDFYKVIEGTTPIDVFIKKWEDKGRTSDIWMSDDEEVYNLWKKYCDFTISRTGFMYCIMWVGAVMTDLIIQNKDISNEFHNIGHKLILALTGE